MHESGCLILSASTSGAIQKKRSDPFSFFDANVKFYKDCASDEVANRTYGGTETSRLKSKQRSSATPKVSKSVLQREQKPIFAADVDMVISLLDDSGRVDSSAPFKKSKERVT